jgi:hypothetical protein
VAKYGLENVDLSTLDTQLQSTYGIDPTSDGTNINAYLIGLGDTTGVSDPTNISVMFGTPPFPTNQPAKVDIITPGGNYSIDTDQFPQLQAIILDATSGAQNLTVTGSSNVLVVGGDGTNTITLQDHGNDVVEAGDNGTGHETITGGFGADTLLSSGSSDSVVAGSGAHSFIYEAGSNATLVGGSGAHDSISANGSNDSLVAGARDALLLAGAGGGETLDGGSFGHVTLEGGSGTGQVLMGHGQDDVLRTGTAHHESLTGAAGSDSIYAGGAGFSGAGGGTLVGGGSDEHFFIGDQGNDTIHGSGSGDTVHFTQQDGGPGHGVSITSHSGITTVSFAESGQQFTISGVQTLVFANGHVVHL